MFGKSKKDQHVLKPKNIHDTYMLSCLVMSSLCDPMDHSPRAPLSMEILQSRILEQVAMPSSKGFSKPRDWTQVSRIAGGFFTIWATSEARDTCIKYKKITRQCYSLIPFICKFIFLILLVSRYRQSIPQQVWWNNVRGKIFSAE